MKIDDIFDENVLIDILFREAGNHEVRAEAVKKINNMKILIDIARTDGNHEVRAAAVKKINDWEILIDIARTDENKYIRKIATAKLVNY
ncbi:MAG: hypothetical protein LBU74_06775 [Methanobacteriaceae archaeon]|jgi:hypothetical protein|nr:hypothetical protein [Candidatus Methanorudis spinitermitis]